MPLSSSILKNELAKFIDQDSPSFIAFPQTSQEAAVKWANALQVYSAAIIPPSITTANIASLISSLQGISDGNFLAIFPTALGAYTANIGLGMVGFTAVPPLSATLTPLLTTIIPSLGLAGVKSDIILTQFCTIIDTWYKTGVSTLQVSPFTVVPWT